MRISRIVPTATIAMMGLLGSAVHAQDVSFQRVWPNYREAASFTRLREYFGGSPDATNRAALRTQPDRRTGYYWLVRTAASADLPDCTLRLELHRTGQTDISIHAFPFSVSAGSHVVNVGLTGTDWTDPAERPVAWQLTLLSPSGSPLATEQSFLWQRQTD
jgi:hypothetical protein